jgi:hypothetical protein
MNVDITPTDGFPHMYDYVNRAVGVGANPIVLVILTLIIIAYYLLFSYLGISRPLKVVAVQAATASPGVKFIEIIMWALFIFLVMINGIQYFFSIDIKTGIKNLFTPVPEVDITVTTEAEQEPESEPEPELGEIPVPEIKTDPQVYHVGQNDFGYVNARALCAAYGGRLATIGEVQDSYNKGAEWCNYGWSEGQMALYPTQTTSWNKFQDISGHEHDCGRPGVNGGFIANPDVKFGINCYGYKPKMTQLEKNMLDNENTFPLTATEKKFDKKVKYYRTRLPNYLVSPFNYDKWSQI